MSERHSDKVRTNNEQPTTPKSTVSGTNEDKLKSTKAVPSRGVKFNPEVLETSILGTCTPKRIRDDRRSVSILEEKVKIAIEINQSSENASDKDKTTHTLDVSHTHSVSRPRRYTVDSSINQTPECYQPVSVLNRKRTGSVEILVGPDDENSSIVVAVRVRPMTTRELCASDVRCVVAMSDNETIVTTDKSDELRFAYDYSFWSYDKVDSNFASQLYVYESFAQPLLAKAFDGYNTCLFAYGQTGSGKSYSITGDPTDPGIIPQFCEELFARIHSAQDVDFGVEVSFYEIYKEKIRDLLSAGNGESKSIDSNKDAAKNLKVREHPTLGPYVEGLSSYRVKSYADIKNWLDLGNSHRVTAATCMNDRSSRSHSVFTVLLTQTKVERIDGAVVGNSMNSRINIVDLAGSERQSLAKTSGDRLREGASINRSLMTLGKVISMLAEVSSSAGAGVKRKKVFIPYRDSVLTWLLKESLGGNSKTAMLATISPASTHIEETLSTLRYAKQARTIINNAKVNDDPKARLIRELRSEIEKLRQQGSSGTSVEDNEAHLALVAQLKDKLTQKEHEMDAVAKQWEERLRQIESRKLEEARRLEEEQRRHKMQMEAQSEEAEKKMRQLAAEKQMLEVEVSASRRREELAAEAKAACATPRFLDFPLLRQLEQARDQMRTRVQHLQQSAGRSRVASSVFSDTPTPLSTRLFTQHSQDETPADGTAAKFARQLLCIVTEHNRQPATDALSLTGEIVECCIQINLLTGSAGHDRDGIETKVMRLVERTCRLVTLTEARACVSASSDCAMSPVTRELGVKLTTACNDVLSAVMAFLQVCEAVGGSSMSTTDVRTATQRMCHLCGSLSLATDSVLTKLDTSLAEHMEVMKGCSQYTMQVLRGGLRSIGDNRKKLSTFGNENAVPITHSSELLTFGKKLFDACDTLLQLLVKYQMAAVDHGVTYGQCHQIIRCVTDLVDNMSLLVQAIGAVVRGERHGSTTRVVQSVALVQKSVTRLLADEVIDKETGGDVMAACHTVWDVAQAASAFLNPTATTGSAATAAILSPKRCDNSPLPSTTVKSEFDAHKSTSKRRIYLADLDDSQTSV